MSQAHDYTFHRYKYLNPGGIIQQVTLFTNAVYLLTEWAQLCNINATCINPTRGAVSTASILGFNDNSVHSVNTEGFLFSER